MVPVNDGQDPADTGLFGKLPRTRPGTRSPRRSASGEAETRGAAAKAEPAKAPRPVPTSRVGTAASEAPEPPSAEPAAGRPRPDAGSPEPEEQGPGLEELAWAGIAVTAEAATLGVRLMSRALDAARRATERG
jgi:hypothetical protein